METVNKADLIMKLLATQIKEANESRIKALDMFTHTSDPYWSKRAEDHEAAGGTLLLLRVEVEHAEKIFEAAGIELK